MVKGRKKGTGKEGARCSDAVAMYYQLLSGGRRLSEDDHWDVIDQYLLLYKYNSLKEVEPCQIIHQSTNNVLKTSHLMVDENGTE